jgi:putative nucleotidyltransferase with HDIG domain
MEALSNDEIETSAVEGILASDAVFTADILFCANSALFGLITPVTNLRRAIVHLGRDRLRNVVLTTALRSFAKAPLRSPYYRSWWRHSLATAVLSDALGAAASFRSPATYAAGLLHDIGRLGLLMIVSERDYRRYAQSAANGRQSHTECERAFFGRTHCEIGGQLLKEWKMPREIVDAAEGHHDAALPEDWERVETRSLVRVACEMARLLDFEALKHSEGRTVQDVLESLPERLRLPLSGDSEALKTALNKRISSLDPA